jgi:hypothetical protein
VDDLSALLPWMVPYGVGMVVGYPLALAFAHYQRMADPDQKDSPRERKWRAGAYMLALVFGGAVGVEAAHLVGLSRLIGFGLGVGGGASARWVLPAFEADVWPVVVGALRRVLGGGSNDIDSKGNP